MLKKYLLLIVLFLVGCSSPPSSPPQTVSKVNLKDYMGTWYEISSFPNRFQKGCRCTQATYELRKNKEVKVVNQCYKGERLSRVVGKAWAVPDSKNSKLKVQFFWPFQGDYWILYLTPGYKQVIVGSPNRKYLWILSRTRSINSETYQKLKTIANQKGFAVERLVKTKQSCERY